MNGTRSSSLNDGRRNAEIDRLAGGEAVDLVVIGGGITGAGVALDAATRGLRVALVERRDLANGTSGLSSKLAHGGLRYLRQGEVAVAWESARERHILMTRTAPHLVRPMAFVAPLDDAMRPVYGAFAETGIRVGDVMRAAAGTTAQRAAGTASHRRRRGVAVDPEPAPRRPPRRDPLLGRQARGRRAPRDRGRADRRGERRDDPHVLRRGRGRARPRRASATP